jgi:hypothetical protein
MCHRLYKTRRTTQQQSCFFGEIGFLSYIRSKSQYDKIKEFEFHIS